jgi:hypothetical protein
MKTTMKFQVTMELVDNDEALWYYDEKSDNPIVGSVMIAKVNTPKIMPQRILITVEEY